MIKEKHPRAIRWFHWINFPLLALMVWSGALIYWANDAYILIPPRLAETLGISARLSEGLGWHFLLMWLFFLNGLLYISYLMISGEWRVIFPDRACFKEAIAVLLHDLRLKKTAPPIRGKFNAAQRIAYTAVILMGLGSLLTGIAIKNPVQAGGLTELLGGYEAARFEHFLLTVGFVLFFFVHVAQVIKAGWGSFRAMVVGDEIRGKFARALAFGLTLYLLAYVSFLAIQKGPQIDGTPALIRKSYQINEALGFKVYSRGRLSVKKPKPSSTKAPRVNGLIGLKEKIDLEHYQVTVEMGEKTQTFPMSAFQVLPKTGYSTDFKCIEGWSEVVQYAGAKFSDFLEAYHLGKKPGGSYYRYVGLETPDEEYYVSIDMDSMLHPQTVLAYEMNEQNLSLENGAPLRLMIPIKYGIKNIKRIGKIVFSDERPADYWAEQGYDWWSGL